MRTTHSAIAHAAGRLTVPIEIRPDIGAALAAGVADKPRLQIGQADVIQPRVGAELLPMRAASSWLEECAGVLVTRAGCGQDREYQVQPRRARAAFSLRRIVAISGRLIALP